jgi:VCBS repeat-containing protein
MKSIFKLILASAIICTSCSSDDVSDTNNGTTEPQLLFTGDFFPLSVNNEWNYNVENIDNSDPANNTTSTDALKVESQNGNTYTLSVNNNGTANGTMNNILISGELTATETQLTSTGSLVFPLGGANDISIDFTNAKFYDTTKNINEEIYTVSQTITQTVQNIPLTINYTLKSTQLENLETYISNGTSYTNVTSARIDLNLAVSATITVVIPTTLSVIDNQNVLSINAYYADGIGLVYAESDSGFNLNAQTVALLQQAGIDLGGIPTSVSTTNIQTLDTFTVN